VLNGKGAWQRVGVRRERRESGSVCACRTRSGMFNRHKGKACNIFMRIRTVDGEHAVFKDDKGRFTSSLSFPLPFCTRA
jgi:hypothetical protein